MQKLLFPLALIICIFACCCPSCATRPSVPVAAPSPLRPTMVVVSGQARIQSDGGHILVVEGQEAVITVGDQITAGEDGLKLLLANGSLLYLNPGTELQVITFSAEGTVRLRQLKGQLEVEAISPLLTVEISTTFVDNFVLKTMQFTATPTVRDTTFQLWLDGVDAHLTVESGEVQVTSDDRTETIPAGSEVKAIPGEGLIVSPADTPVSPTPTSLPPPSPAASGAPVDLTVYLRGTNNAQGFAPFRGEQVNAGAIYSEGDTIYGEVAVRIGDTVYHFDQNPEPAGVEQLPDPYHLEVQFSDPLLAATGSMQPGFNPKKAQFWVGTLNCNSATQDKPYKIEMTLYAGGEARKHTEISFLVADAPLLCGGTPEAERIWQPPPTYTPTPLYSPTPTPTPSCDLTVYLRGTNNAEGFAAFSGEHVPPRRDDTPFRVEFKFSDSLLAATKDVQPGFSESSLRFWAGILDCDSATPEPYKIEATLYKDEKIRKHTEINFLVVDNPLCDRP